MIPERIVAQVHAAERLTVRDHKQRWVDMSGKIHTTPIPYIPAVSVSYLPIAKCCSSRYREPALAHSAIPYGS